METIVIINIDSGSILIKDVAYTNINIITSSKNYIEEQWFTEDNNFLGNEIESVLQDKTMNNGDSPDGHIFLTFDTNPTSIDKQISSLSSITYSQNRKTNS